MRKFFDPKKPISKWIFLVLQATWVVEKPNTPVIGTIVKEKAVFDPAWQTYAR
jgi:hypothetical protein